MYLLFVVVVIVVVVVVVVSGSFGGIVLVGLLDGVHNLRIISKTGDGQRYVLRRKIYIGMLTILFNPS